jgi:hypothetical protein
MTKKPRRSGEWAGPTWVGRMRPELKAAGVDAAPQRPSWVTHSGHAKKGSQPRRCSPRRAPISSDGSLRRPTSNFASSFPLVDEKRESQEAKLSCISDGFPTNRESSPFGVRFKADDGVPQRDASRQLRARGVGPGLLVCTAGSCAADAVEEESYLLCFKSRHRPASLRLVYPESTLNCDTHPSCCAFTETPGLFS